MSSSIAPVHGGLSAPIDRIVADADLDRAALDDAARIDVDETDRTTLYRIADGTLSPLEGPMGKADLESTLAHAYIERDGKKWAWGIPVVLPVTDAEAATCQPGETAALV
ncbi:MAG: sulfate adenylyltransferase, partial [Planctomycetota bacterium]